MGPRVVRHGDLDEHEEGEVEPEVDEDRKVVVYNHDNHWYVADPETETYVEYEGNIQRNDDGTWVFPADDEVQEFFIDDENRYAFKEGHYVRLPGVAHAAATSINQVDQSIAGYHIPTETNKCNFVIDGVRR